MKEWVFRWVLDEEGDIGLLLFQRILLVKYKEHTIIRWASRNFRDAPRFMRAA